MKKIILLLISILILCCALTSAKQYHISLLTVGEVGDQIIGGTADAYLDVKHGTGRIFLDSFPLTKLDTQISTRYANEVACDYLNMDCSRYDFFYTIRADSTVVGGPSASAPLTILTIAALKNLNLRNDTIMTGTINSGGSIGPVGGIIKKAMAAKKEGFKRVLIPVFAINTEEELNDTDTINAINITNKTSRKDSDLTLKDINLSIDIIQIRSIEDALPYFTDKPVKQLEGEIIVPDEYTKIMSEVADALCTRAFSLKERVRLDEGEINKSNAFMVNINKSLADEDYYSAASYCFSLGLLMRKANMREIEEKNPSQLKKIYRATSIAVNDFDNKLESINLTTLSELETYIIVKERLLEAEESLVNIENNISSDELAYAVERYFSAVYWSSFFKFRGEKMQLDKEYLKEACYKKLSEADERLNYAGLYIPIELQSAKTTVNQAYAFALSENYKMCLFKASFAKAESNLLLSSLSIETNEVNSLVDEKLRAAKKVIVKEQNKGFFPIMGYSYYEYANALKDNNDAVSGLIFSEYALELSNIEIYFPKKEGFRLPNINYGLIAIIAGVFLFGITIGMSIAVKTIKKAGKSAGKKNKKKQ
ncbi:hypothetical protein JW756_05270 [Candidatus Woesearchaeota archaeon]|nr:hypothetical protein [Candidatus Woesearchaeota archaeon]